MDHRRLGAAAGLATALLLVVPCAPASAHGAPTNPVSRSVECGTEGGAAAASAACRAARAASGDPDLADWDNVRVPDVDGRDREVVPDGKLCSGGLDAYRGLDLPRTDWPTTVLTAGARITFTYRGTIPHRGEFRFFVTREPYDPAVPLRWSDLEEKPFLQVKDPPLRDGSYRVEGTLPAGRTGRHVIYTIWENSSTPDTYYSCSDVVIRAPAASRTQTPSAGAPQPGSSGSARGLPATPPAGGTVGGLAPVSAASEESGTSGTWLVRLAAVIGFCAVAVAAGVASRRRTPK